MTSQFFRSTSMLCGTVGAAFLSVSAVAADMVTKTPNLYVKEAMSAWAVDGLNGKAEVLGGSLARRPIVGASGSFSAPLGREYGLQIDGNVGNFDRRGFGNIGAHLFWRDPGRGLIGIYTSHTGWARYGGAYVGQVAAEGEVYWQRWTLQGIAGVEFGNSVSATTFGTTIVPGGNNILGSFTTGYDIKTRFFDQVNLNYYLNDDWKAFIGHRYLGGKNALALGSEYAFNIGMNSKASAFIEARVGSRDFQGVWGGLKLYFSPKDKPLIARHRQDDPYNWGVDSLFSITNSATSSSTSTLTPCTVSCEFPPPD